MTNITLTELEIKELYNINNFDFNALLNNTIQDNKIILNNNQYEQMYDILMEHCENLFVADFLVKFIKHDNNKFIKPINII